MLFQVFQVSKRCWINDRTATTTPNLVCSSLSSELMIPFGFTKTNPDIYQFIY